MFCDRCGAQLLETNRFCPVCGKPVAGNMPLMPVQSRIAGHIRMLGILWLALSGMLLVGGAVMQSIFRSNGMWEGGFPPGAPPFVHDILNFIGILLLGGGVLGVAAGWGLLDRQAWARMLTIVLAGFALLLFMPFGTLLGIYSLWVLLPAQSEEEYRKISRPA
jgi:zinc-ribbon domain